MKFRLFSLGLLSVSPFLILSPISTPAASAACAMTDVSVQVAVHDKLKHPAEQESNVTQESVGRCLGNTITSTTTQFYFGDAGAVKQQIDSHQHLSGGTGYGIGVNTPVIKTPVEVKVDVDNPATRLKY